MLGNHPFVNCVWQGNLDGSPWLRHTRQAEILVKPQSKANRKRRSCPRQGLPLRSESGDGCSPLLLQLLPRSTKDHANTDGLGGGGRWRLNSSVHLGGRPREGGFQRVSKPRAPRYPLGPRGEDAPLGTDSRFCRTASRRAEAKRIGAPRGRRQ